METLTQTSSDGPVLPESPAPSGDALLTWSAPIHPVHERTTRWYTLASLAVGITVLVALFNGAWSLALVAILTACMYFLLRKSPPVIRTISLRESGFEFDGAFTAWGDCDGFWIIRTPAWNELSIRRKGFATDVRIQTADIDVSQIRAVVSQYLPERSDRKELWMDAFIRLCKL